VRVIRTIKALLRDSVIWGLGFLLLFTITAGLTTLFERYDKYETYKKRLYEIEYDIVLLKQDLESKKDWARRLESDPAAWEQVAREKMNYLAPDEILVTFVPGR